MTVTERPEVRRWCDDLLLALRMRDVPGARIGEVLTEVRAHLADSGEDPEEAFGAPADYAAALAADAPPESRRSWLTTRASAAALCLGVMWLVEGASGLATGEPGRVGPVVLLTAVLAGTAAPWVVEQVGTAGRGAPAAGRLAGLVALVGAALAGLALLGHRWHADAPAGLLLAAGALLLVAAAVVGRPAADPVVDPFEAPEAVAARSRRDTLAVAAVLWGSLAVMATAAVLVAVVLDRLG